MEPRRQQEPRTSDPNPAARGTAVLTFLPPRKSLRRIPLRPLQSPPSPCGTIDVSAPKVHFQALGESPIKVPGRAWDSETWHCGAASGARRHLPQVRAFAFSRSPGFRRMPLCFVSSPVLNQGVIFVRVCIVINSIRVVFSFYDSICAFLLQAATETDFCCSQQDLHLED